jgi:hypothetical protein
MSGTAPCDIIVEFDEARASALLAPADRFRLLRCPGGSFLDSQFLEHQFVLADVIVSCRQILPVSRIGPEPPKTAQIWFAPFMFGQGAPAWQNGFGAHDYLDLFKEGAPWNKASSRIQVFKFYINVLNRMSDAQLEQVVQDLNRRGIAIGVEAYLIWTDRSSQPVESVARNSADATLRIARRIKAAGGTLRYVAMDEPFMKGSFAGPAKGGGLPVEEVARLVAGYVQSVKGEFPDVIIGDIEYQSTEEGIERALEAYHTVSGEYFPFLHLDVEGGDSHWPERAKALENYTHARGIAFGIIYNGNMHDPTDAAWLEQAEDHMAAYETLAGGRPDHVIFQSWAEHPHYLLPETDSSKFTWLINHYFAQRTVLNVGFSSSSPEQLREAVGKLTTSTGDPVGGARIEVSVMPGGRRWNCHR